MAPEKQVHKKDGVIFMVQIDHLEGETLGWAINQLYELGALNVQMIPTITKKNRPAHILIIDASPNQVDEIETFFMVELRTTGWHILKSLHKYVATEIVIKEIVLYVDDQPIYFTLEGKQIKGDIETMRPENRSCVAIYEGLKKEGLNTISFQNLQYKLTDLLKDSDKNELMI